MRKCPIFACFLEVSLKQAISKGKAALSRRFCPTETAARWCNRIYIVHVTPPYAVRDDSPFAPVSPAMMARLRRRQTWLIGTRYGEHDT